MVAGIASARRVELLAAPMEGMRKGLRQAEEAAERIADGDISPENVVAQMEGMRMVQANAASARTAQAIVGSLLNVRV